MTQEYPTRNFGQPTKRYCQTLDLKNDPELIRTYQIYHSESEMWPEILEGFHTIGILEMELYQLEERLFMIVETPLDFDWDTAMERLATLPRQAEWEAFVSRFQKCSPEDTSNEKWKMMTRIFHFYK